MDTFWAIFTWILQNLVWEVLLSLAAAIGLTAAVNKGLGKLPDGKSILWFSGSVFFVALAFFYALMWRPSPIPDLHPQINFVAYGGENPSDIEKVPYVTIAMTITNTGVPSIANSWALEAITDGRKYEGEMQAIPDSLALGLTGEPYQIIYIRSSLGDRATNTPIPTGGQVVGLLMARFPKLAQDFFKGKTPDFKVTFKDVNERVYSATEKVTGERARPGHVAGLSELRQRTPVSAPAQPAPPK